MAARICPIFDEQASFIGLWVLNPGFQASLGTVAELMSLAEPTLMALQKRPQRRIPNQSVEVGNSVRFEDGIFIMLDEEKAPNEELSQPDSNVAYVLIDHGGIGCLMRSTRTDSRLQKMPPVATPPPKPDEGPIETKFRVLARDLARQHGPLRCVEYLSHFPTFEINFVFDKKTVFSGASDGQYDIHRLALGYVGAGPRYARVFLDELGFSMTTDEIAAIGVGDVVKLEGNKAVIHSPTLEAATSSEQPEKVIPTPASKPAPPPKKTKMGKIFGVAIVLILAAGLLPWARKEWLRHKTVNVKPAEVSIHANQSKDDHASTSAAATTKLPEKTAAQRSSEYLALNAKRKGVITTASGLQYEIIRAGAGPKPKAEDSIRALYHGTLINGNVFDSSLEQKEPATMALKEVIPGWSEGLQLMSQGAKYKFFIPAKLAYGEKGAESVGPHEALIFEVELVEIQPAAPPVVMQPGVYQGSTSGIPSFSVSLVADDQGLKVSELGYEFAGFASVGHAFPKSKQPFGTFGNGTLTFQFRVLTSIQVPNLNTSGANLGSANYQAEITSEKDGVLKCELSQIAELAQAYSDFSFEEITFHFEEKNPALQKNYTLVLQSAQKGGTAPNVAVNGTAVMPPNQPPEPFVVVARDLVEEQVWEQACKERTIRAFKAYMAAYPSGLYAAEARAKQAILRLDDAPYAAALQLGTESAMKAFLNDFPGHSNEADMQRALKDLTEGRNK
jgi:FKBP-type peptidyl-prolyl cis-trans isomerase